MIIIIIMIIRDTDMGGWSIFQLDKCTLAYAERSTGVCHTRILPYAARALFCIYR